MVKIRSQSNEIVYRVFSASGFYLYGIREPIFFSILTIILQKQLRRDGNKNMNNVVKLVDDLDIRTNAKVERMISTLKRDLTVRINRQFESKVEEISTTVFNNLKQDVMNDLGNSVRTIVEDNLENVVQAEAKNVAVNEIYTLQNLLYTAQHDLATSIKPEISTE